MVANRVSFRAKECDIILVLNKKMAHNYLAPGIESSPGIRTKNVEISFGNDAWARHDE